jgi:hypothetical protein
MARLIFFVLILCISNIICINSKSFGNICSDSLISNSDSTSACQFHNYSGYVALGFPLGLGTEIAYRPSSFMAVSFEANASILIPNLIQQGRYSLSFEAFFATQSISNNGGMNAVSASFIVLLPMQSYSTIYSMAINFGTMPGSMAIFNWKFGAMLWLRDHATTFFRRITGLPLLSISFKIL